MMFISCYFSWLSPLWCLFEHLIFILRFFKMRKLDPLILDFLRFLCSPSPQRDIIALSVEIISNFYKYLIFEIFWEDIISNSIHKSRFIFIMRFRYQNHNLCSSEPTLYASHRGDFHLHMEFRCPNFKVWVPI